MRIKAQGQSHPAIKLPRQLVKECGVHTLSESFSHKKKLDGKHVYIYCTSSHGTVTNVLWGVIKRVSHKGAREWALLAERAENMKTFDVHKLTRI